MASITRHPYLFLGAFSLLQLWPWLVFDIGGDSHIYQYYAECFARTLLDGEIRPSWCRFSEGGFGNFIFFLYFPLPYYLMSLFYPLKWLGASIEHVFMLQIYLANLLFALTSFWWLKGHVTTVKALLIACLMLYVPYRFELLYYRAAHAELFAIALIPLWLIGVERIIKQPKQWHMLALVCGVTALTHTHTALMCGALVFLYATLLLRQLRVSSSIALAGIIGGAIAAYFILPALYYQQFILGTSVTDYMLVSVNRYPIIEDLHSNRARLMILTGCSLLAVLGLYVAALWRNKYLPIMRSTHVWVIVFCVAMALYSPLVAPLFDNSEIVRAIFFPWRMQIVFIPVIAVLLITFCRQSDSSKKTKVADLVVLFLFLNLLQALVANVVLPGQEQSKRLITEQLVKPIGEYQSIWTSKGFSVEARDPLIISGSGVIHSYHSSSDQVSLSIEMFESGVVSLHQAYFPSWSATNDEFALKVVPDPKTGGTLISAPKGKQRITLTHQPYANGPIWVQASPWISLAALFYVLIAWRRERIASRA